MHATLRGIDHKFPLTGSSRLSSPYASSPSRTFAKRSTRSAPCTKIACQQRPDTGRPVWRQRTDQVVQQLSTWFNTASEQFDSAIMPRERGDLRDQTLMALSLAALVLFSMQLFRVYAHLYNAAGFRTFSDMMRH
ncbi:hypothetical protein WJX82_009200 [Trebouxia sp. C0006]